MRNVIVIVMLVSFVTSAAFAANPADLTSYYRTFTTPLTKVAYDGGPWYAFQYLPIGNKASIGVNRWQDATGLKVQNQLILSAKATKYLDVCLDAEKWQNGKDCTDAVFDLHVGKIGFGVRTPMLDGGTTKLGPRVKFGSCTAFATIPLDGGVKLYGLTRLANKIQTDLAYGTNHITYLNISYCGGKVIPELRLKWTPTENFVGFAISYRPR